MAFRFHCPKCNTSSFSIERDSRSYAPRGQPHELIFSCRCGKQMFGPQIEKEYDRQKAEYEANPDNKATESTPAPSKRDEQFRKAYAHQAAYQAQKRKDAESAAQAKKADDDRKWRERVSQTSTGKPKPASKKVAGLADGAGEKMGSQGCGWHTCDNPPRPNSKYCSRDCSNKNARARYKRRKAADKAA